MSNDRKAWLRNLLWQIINLAFHELKRLDERRFRFDYSVGPVVSKLRRNNMDITINNTQKVNVTLHPVDHEVPPQPAPIDGVPVWSVIDGDATVVPAADGLSCFLVSGAPDVVSHIQVSADADPGSGVQTITGIIQLTVTHPFATNLGLTADAPVPK